MLLTSDAHMNFHHRLNLTNSVNSFIVVYVEIDYQSWIRLIKNWLNAWFGIALFDVHLY